MLGGVEMWLGSSQQLWTIAGWDITYKDCLYVCQQNDSISSLRLEKLILNGTILLYINFKSSAPMTITYIHIIMLVYVHYWIFLSNF